MKNKNTLVLGGVFLLLVIVYFATTFHPREVTKGAAPLFKRGIPDIDRIEVSSPREEQVTLEKQGGKWYITKPIQYKASESVLKVILNGLDAMMVDGVVSSKKEDQLRFDVTDSSAVHLKAYSAGKVVLDALIGKYTPNVSHTYVRMNGSDDIVLWRGIASRLVLLDIDDWRDRTVYSFNESDITSVTLTGTGVFRRFTLSDSTWTCTENGTERSIDQARVWASVQVMAELAGDAIAGEEDIPRAGATPPDIRVSFTVRNGDAHSFELWVPKTEIDQGRYLLRPEKGEILYVLGAQRGAILTFDPRNLAVRQ